MSEYLVAGPEPPYVEPMWDGERPHQPVRRYERQIYVRTVAATFVGASMLWLDLVVFYPVYPARRGLGGVLGLVAVVALPYYAVAIFLAAKIAGRRFRAATLWVEQQRVPTDHELSELAKMSTIAATQALFWWIGAYLWTMPYLYFVAGYRPGLTAYAKITTAYVLAAMVAWTLAEIAVRRTLRPLRAMAVRNDVRRLPRTMGIFIQLLLVWIVVAARPLIEAGGMLVGLDAAQLERVVPVIWGICVASAFAGILVTWLSSRAITEPLERLRHGLLAVERGRLDVDLPVDEAGEIGLLQAGFNRMVAALRDRDRLFELFGRHVGADVARQAMEGSERLGGELREATAMFVDVIGSTALAETRSPDDVVADLNRFFDAVVTVVGAHGGFVNKFAGDGALCVFGVPASNDDHAGSALDAAMALIDELERRLAEANIEAAIGISSGWVVAGNVGALNRYEFTVIGGPVNEASRLTEEAKHHPGRVLASSTTIHRARDDAGWVHVATLELRGRREPTESYAPAAARSAKRDRSSAAHA